MGGEREVQVKKESKIGKFRIHENNGEVHFHDDESKLKTVVSVAEWWKAWQRLKVYAYNWEYVDIKNGTFLSARSDYEGAVFDIYLNIIPIEVGKTYKLLNDFTKGR